MRYAKPEITRISIAVSTIKSTMKGAGSQEGSTHFLTTGPAYQADE
jgi:hypothetical protein